ncbi:pentapeptide repeat-containing protein [Amycolatopsis palatopharyngis]|uniref:pentapeptide repeat-containing protein n=1 Tax=Amycolatopsis palatopharyngis TaxID=187982 RepID=UPI000E23948D|nr:hypothetical protein [Amycolatopsis palatopharyngis]
MSGASLRRRAPLLGTILCSVLLLVLVSGWLLTEDQTSRSDALRTGGLAGGAVIALYALWLNDRRRRVEEARQEIERQRHEHDRERVADERFARSVELLGNEADQVRVGALHALAALAKGRVDYTQTVLDVLCAYLRRPFGHSRYDDGGGATHDNSVAAEHELQVRLTAQRLVVVLLPKTGEPHIPAPDLDLTGAVLEYLDLSGRRIGELTLRYARLHSTTDLSGCEISGPAWFTAAEVRSGRLGGRFLCRDVLFHDRAGFDGFTVNGLADFTGTRFEAASTFTEATFENEVSPRAIRGA